MGGLACMKEIIDRRAATKARLRKASAALDKALDCMETSLLIWGNESKPTYEQQHEFQVRADRLAAAFETASDGLAAYAAEIEKSVREGG